MTFAIPRVHLPNMSISPTSTFELGQLQWQDTGNILYRAFTDSMPLQEAETLGVDIDHPPNSKIFDASNHSDDEDDIAALARRRRAQLAGRDHNNQSNITVNFAGLAELIRPSSPSAASRSVSSRPKAIPPKLDLRTFAYQFGVPMDLCDKLEAIHFNGPHLFRLISDEQLRTEGGLSLGELTILRDAEERWKEGH